VIPNGFDMRRMSTHPAAVHDLRTSCDFTADTFVVGTLGRFTPEKDQRTFVDAAAIVARQFPQARFLIVGRGCDWANPVLSAWIVSTGYKERFALLGQRADVGACLGAMDVFCLTSRTEGFPNALGEAMIMGKACIATDVGDSALLLGDCGIIVPPSSPSAVAQAIVNILTLSPDERNRLGDRAHGRIDSEFTIERTRQRFDAVYSEVSSTSSRPRTGRFE
jgi:glycosyltransferase involved in cell wall biosynthesis